MSTISPPLMEIYLIPTILAEDTAPYVLPASVYEAIQQLDIFFVENVRTARRFISSLKTGKAIDSLVFYELTKDTPPIDTRNQLKSLPANAGILSEAGVPCIADPGSIAVKFAHELGYRVKPLTGPSSILLALMGSGFAGQSFTFHGYLPIERSERTRRIIEIEKAALRTGQTQLFMETPYRNNQLLESVLNACQPTTHLCLAANLTGADEFLQTHTISFWRKTTPDLNRKPTIFLIGIS